MFYINLFEVSIIVHICLFPFIVHFLFGCAVNLFYFYLHFIEHFHLCKISVFFFLEYKVIKVVRKYNLYLCFYTCE